MKKLLSVLFFLGLIVVNLSSQGSGYLGSDWKTWRYDSGSKLIGTTKYQRDIDVLVNNDFYKNIVDPGDRYQELDSAKMNSLYEGKIFDYIKDLYQRSSLQDNDVYKIGLFKTPLSNFGWDYILYVWRLEGGSRSYVRMYNNYPITADDLEDAEWKILLSSQRSSEVENEIENDIERYSYSQSNSIFPIQIFRRPSCIWIEDVLTNINQYKLKKSVLYKIIFDLEELDQFIYILYFWTDGNDEVYETIRIDSGSEGTTSSFISLNEPYKGVGDLKTAIDNEYKVTPVDPNKKEVGGTALYYSISRALDALKSAEGKLPADIGSVYLITIADDGKDTASPIKLRESVINVRDDKLNYAKSGKNVTYPAFIKQILGETTIGGKGIQAHFLALDTAAEFETPGE